MSAAHRDERINALAPLQVIDHLRVGPVQLTANRLSMPYTVFRKGEEASNALVYKYDEAVFDPSQASSQQLASVIGAQLAINYGLFCKTITFDGLFSTADQRFIEDMMENTAREILVNKFYQPNPFLLPEVSRLPVVKREKYTQAKVQFVNTALLESIPVKEEWALSQDRYCVLSSGGKDSLLSYGLLNEAGLEAHAIFGNESGRHWFTALNGYRGLRAADPNTARVWMNSDRLFSWMLRQLPFVRQDFARMRADDYPIRLWTVAVFLFGVLPLMKKRELGRLVIGNEYDSTQRIRFQGIPHYNGLYDQSRYFDQALSRYFRKNGWNIRQFSLLRPLSELLIMKILLHRYPELQQHQVSCHAAHEKDGRIYPCGKCEKCRRIVGMITALEADPSNCGYDEQQVQSALSSLQSKKVKQIGTDASHLYYLLSQKGVLESKGRAYPEIMSLRFDRERSTTEDLPSDLSTLLYPIMLEHAEGALKREGHQWQPVQIA
jgi:hypothetical protein